jgi:tRNA threonylcarbamoyladenosine biosynthesis protein TsaB
MYTNCPAYHSMGRRLRFRLIIVALASTLPAAMKILALDSSTEHCSVALRYGAARVFRETLAGQTHSAVLLGMVREVLREAQLDLRDLDGIAFGAGPGSFTGLRMACGIAQGLAYGAQLPVAAVSTLLALAHAGAARRVVVALDARMGEIYHAAYEHDGADWTTVVPPNLCRPEHAPPVPGSGWSGAGSGFGPYGAALAARYRGRLDAIIADAYPHAQHIAALAVRMFERGEATTAAAAAPIYLRQKVAFTEAERAASR